MKENKKIDNQNEIYKAVFDFSPQAIVILDNKGKVLNINGRFFDWLGYKPSEAVNKNMASLPFLPKESKIKVVKKFAQRMLGKKVAPYELLFTSKKGAEVLGLVAANLIKSKDGKTTRDLVMISDITQQKNAEKTLIINQKKSLESQRLLSEIASELNQTTDFDVSINNSLKMLGAHTQVSRVYIFEDSADKEFTKNTYEWCNKGIAPQIENLQKISHQSIPSWNKILKNKKMIISNDVSKLPQDIYAVLKPQQIKSILVFPIKAKESTVGFIGFDEIKNDREWLEPDVELLRAIASNIAGAYSRRDIRNKLEAQLEQLEKTNQLMVDRELKMIELKKQLKKQ